MLTPNYTYDFERWFGRKLTEMERRVIYPIERHRQSGSKEELTFWKHTCFNTEQFGAVHYLYKYYFGKNIIIICISVV